MRLQQIDQHEQNHLTAGCALLPITIGSHGGALCAQHGDLLAQADEERLLRLLLPDCCCPS